MSEIIWIGSPNYWPGRNGQKVAFISNHIMQGTLASTDGWFNNPLSQVSATFGVGLDGTIHQYVKEGDSAWANGVTGVSTHTPKWLKAQIAAGVNPNRISISIEHEGFSGDKMPEAQYQGTLYLHRYLVAKYNIPVDREHIIGHYQILWPEKRNCPGSGFPWERLVKDLLPVEVYNVGAGVIAAMTARGDSPATDEQYYIPSTPQPGLAQRSFTWGKSGLLYLAYEELGADGKPNGQWHINAVKAA